jgi:cold shock CspA family protein
MQGTVKTVDFGFAFITAHGRDYFVHATEIPCDDIGRRFLLPGEAVEFDVGEHQGRTCAKNVELITPRALDYDPKTYFEEGDVVKVHVPRVEVDDFDEGECPRKIPHGQWCYVLRPFGGSAYLHWRNVKSFQTSWEKGVKFYVGQRWRYAIRPPYSGKENDAWAAVDAVEVIQ